MGDAYPDGEVDEVLFWMFDEGRLGRKSNAGFYDYDDKGKRQLLWDGLSANTQRLPKFNPSLHEVQNRLLFAQTLEAVRAIEEGVLMDIREGDVGAILGWGFAPWSGGPLSWLDMVGTPWAAEATNALAEKHGPRFNAPEPYWKRWLTRTKPSTNGSTQLKPPKASSCQNTHSTPAISRGRFFLPMPARRS